jgi:hypothetical protein
VVNLVIILFISFLVVSICACLGLTLEWMEKGQNCCEGNLI